jgi:hypothetical protein
MPSRISKWKGGQGSPNIDDCVLMCNALGIPLTALQGAARDLKPPRVLSQDEIRLLDIVFGGTNPLGYVEAMRRLVAGGAKPDNPGHMVDQTVNSKRPYHRHTTGDGDGHPESAQQKTPPDETGPVHKGHGPSRGGRNLANLKGRRKGDGNKHH